jgi:hypothetical protein
LVAKAGAAALAAILPGSGPTMAFGDPKALENTFWTQDSKKRFAKRLAL